MSKKCYREASIIQHQQANYKELQNANFKVVQCIYMLAGDGMTIDVKYILRLRDWE